MSSHSGVDSIMRRNRRLIYSFIYLTRSIEPSDVEGSGQSCAISHTPDHLPSLLAGDKESKMASEAINPHIRLTNVKTVT